MEEKRFDLEEKRFSEYTLEYLMAREERHMRRLIIALIIAVVGIVISNIVWLYAWTSYDYLAEDSGVETTVSLDGSPGGNANYIGNRGIISNGESYGEDSDVFTEAGTDEVWK